MKTPQELGFPEKFQCFRPSQIEVIEKFMTIQGNLLADAPTGTGKTIMAAALQRLLGVSATYITPNKSLQEQICKDIPYARMVMGRSNYECLLYPDCTAEVCTHTNSDPCEYVERCPYKLARDEAEKSDLAVLNSAYYLYASNYAKKFRRPLLIVDEVDEFHTSLLGYISIDISQRMLSRLRSVNCPLPRADFSTKDWIGWSEAAGPYVRGVIKFLGERKDVEGVALWQRFMSRLEYIASNVDETWFTSVDDLGSITFRPVLVRRYAPSLVWNSHSRILGLSGTILRPSLVGGDLGLQTDYVSVSSAFPIANRPIYDVTKYVGSLSYANIDSSLSRVAETVQRVVDAYPSSKVLVHTHSYSLNRKLCQLLNSPRIVTHSDGKDRQRALEGFLSSEMPLVLLSPSFERGLDLAEDVYNCVIVVKMPFASIKAEAVARRMKMPGGQEWYRRAAAAAFMQMCGRGVRSETKRCDTYVLDGAYVGLSHYFPQWFRQAIVKE